MSVQDKAAASLRAAPRIKIFQPAQMDHGADSPAKVHLLNLSTGGALVYGETVPAVGEEVRLECGLSLGRGRVCWTSGRRFGVAFADPIRSDTIETLVRIQDELIATTTQRLACRERPAGLTRQALKA